MKRTLLHLFVLYVATAVGQTSDCGNALVVCGNEAISTSVFGFGVQELDNTSNPCFFQEVNSIWFELNIAETGTLAFTIRPDEDGIGEDFDFYIFGPGNPCGDLDDPIRCSTTNPLNAGLNYNTTGLRDSETDTSEGPGPDGNSFVRSLEVDAGETYRLLIDRPHGISNFILEWTGTSQFFEQAEINDPAPIELCLAGPDTVVDLTQRQNEIVNSPDVFLEYYNSIADVFDGLNSILDPTEYNPAQEDSTVFVKVTNDNGCFDIVELDVNATAYISGNFEYAACDIDNDRFENFQLGTISADLAALLAEPDNFDISFHANETDAANATAPLDEQNLYRSESTVIYARISSSTETNCFIIVDVLLDVVSSPIPQIAELIQCDVDPDPTDGLTYFNLNQAFDGIPNIEFDFYESLDDLNNSDPIINPENYGNTSAFDQTIYYRVISNDCENSGSLQLRVAPIADLSPRENTLAACDDNADDNVLQANFDLHTFQETNYENLDVVFYTSIQDASLENNPLPESYTSEEKMIYIRLENNNQCQGIEELELIVNALPTIQLEAIHQVCSDGEPLVIEAPIGFDSYNWYRIEGSGFSEIGNTSSVSLSEAGNFRLEVGNVTTHNGQEVVCNSSTEFKVIPSGRARIQEITIEDLSENNSIEIDVTGDGDYEFSIDGITYQNEPIFKNLEAGFYTVLVRDKKGCGISEKEIAIMGFPEFFTPNGDGTNDTWQIIGATNDNLGLASISIFDRYGKLLKQIDTSDNGWDGTLNNTLLPEADYWFKFIRTNGQEFKGHFTLKR